MHHKPLLLSCASSAHLTPWKLPDATLTLLAAGNAEAELVPRAISIATAAAPTRMAVGSVTFTHRILEALTRKK